MKYSAHPASDDHVSHEGGFHCCLIMESPDSDATRLGGTGRACQPQHQVPTLGVSNRNLRWYYQPEMKSWGKLCRKISR